MDKQRAKAIKKKASAQKRDRKPSAFNQIMGDPADILGDQEGIIKQAKEFGVGGADETAVMKYVKEIAKDDFVDEQLPLIQSRRARGGKYRLDEQHFGILFMEVFQHENDKGELIPRYTAISRMLGVPAGTLTKWWQRRDDLKQQQSALIDQGMKYLSTSMMSELMRMMQAMSSLDYRAMFDKPASMKNYISLMNMLINKMRLFTDRSTSNVAHEHKVQLIIPED
jgi:hypothetical protein|tara:strand:+ start:11805 stop:12479 length:675 start_codon:yes stop_codon:yes gene_type:complete